MTRIINLEQTRARNALTRADAAKKDGEGDNLSGYPTLIVNNGLIAALAFSIDKGGQHERIANAIAFHLNDRSIVNCRGGKELRDALCQGDSQTLRQATGEALAFLSYLKRFHR